jgi:hypothetical protein
VITKDCDSTFGNATAVGFPVPQSQFSDAIKCFRERDPNGRGLLLSEDGQGRVIMSVFYVWSAVTDTGVMEIQDTYNKWEDYTTALNLKGAKMGLSPAFQTDANGQYIFMSTIVSLQTGFLAAAALSLILAFMVIIATTGNALIAVYVILTVITTVLTVITLMVWAGFKLGVMESMCLSILVGISIDYALHLAIGYLESSSDLPRAERAAQSLRHVGISVLSGAASTSVTNNTIIITITITITLTITITVTITNYYHNLQVSGIPLLFSTITFFTLFGVFIIVTSLLSFFFSIGLFMSLLFLAGPEGDTGDVTQGSRCFGGGTKKPMAKLPDEVEIELIEGLSKTVPLHSGSPTKHIEV